MSDEQQSFLTSPSRSRRVGVGVGGGVVVAPMLDDILLQNFGAEGGGEGGRGEGEVGRREGRSPQN